MVILRQAFYYTSKLHFNLQLILFRLKYCNAINVLAYHTPQTRVIRQVMVKKRKCKQASIESAFQRGTTRIPKASTRQLHVSSLSLTLLLRSLEDALIPHSLRLSVFLTSTLIFWKNSQVYMKRVIIDVSCCKNI